MDVSPGELAAIEYPFVEQDRLEVSLYGSPITQSYLESPAGTRLIQVEGLSKPWNGETTTESDGVYRFYFDNTGGGEHKEMHLLITYHEPAPGSIVPP